MTSHVRFSVSELIYILLIVFTIVLLGRTIVRLITQKERLRILYGFFLYLVTICASIYAAFCLLWGCLYGLDEFAEQAGIQASGGTEQELIEVTTYFLENTNKYADKVERDQQGRFDEDRNEIFQKANKAYEGLYQAYPFLEKEQTQPKMFTFSKVLSLLNFTGYYFPLTGEANINVDSPAYHLPMTICHEMAHQSGITSEKECNFIGILAATETEDDAYRYSGYLCGFVYLSNALYKENPDGCMELYKELSDTARADLIYNSEYWEQFEGPIQKASNTVYDGFLKSNGDSNGMKSYGLVVDLLLAYYGGIEKENELLPE